MKNNSVYEGDAHRYQMLQHSPDAIALHDGEVLLYVNDAGVRVIGAERPEQIVGQPIIRFIHPDHHETLKQRMQQVRKMKKGLDLFVYKMIRLDGSLFDAETSSIEVPHESGQTLIQSIIRDISKRIKYEAELLEDAERYQRLITFLPEPIVITDNDVIIYANLSAIKLVKGRDVQDMIGMNIFCFFHPNHREEPLLISGRMMQTNEPTPYAERTLIDLTGERIDIEVSSIRLDHYMGRPVILSVLRDLTERKMAEEMIVKSEKLSVIGQLAAGVAHEIRNPLTSLRGFTQLLQKDLGSRYPYLEIMLSELDRINQIVNEFMTLAKPHLVHFETVGLKGIIGSVITLLETQAILNNVTILSRCGDSVPLVRCDSNQLKQVFVNVIKNAIEAMPGGGQVDIDISVRPNGDPLISIQDYGLGIPEDVVRRLGEPFFTTKAHGTGLGLMICHRIIEAHQGTMGISSESGYGTTVEISLPAADDDRNPR
ncbi:histidine kinase [Paenibacillus darwinianus]|uniref:histidine kinase n=1 Tax=Paenibacillus darwinianus TaxID=1380763 RepID=A0A9W5W6L9_9BACL|nr:PAS domain S-box protein [Paenibacillus darwinianus]EXX85290.1 histidine kinase [Paenibacillus darwinianus]EXX85492.1 histidine kinase [Paenibacillus darwinianus]EXX85545.1 histidine kinase [Paenibacillus darwinianus]